MSEQVADGGTAGSGDPIRVLVVDDHPVVRRGMAALLASIDGVDIVGEAASGAEAVREAQLSHPDVVIMDVQMPGMDGIEATRRLTTAVPEVAVLVLTMFDDNESVFAAMRAGASGYLVKGAGQGEILRAIRSVAGGEAIFGPSVARRMLDFFATGGRRPADLPPFPELTEREREVLDLIAAGHANHAIARRLVISPKTVSNHISAIFAKLHVADRAEAIVRAREAGLGGAERH